MKKELNKKELNKIVGGITQDDALDLEVIAIIYISSTGGERQKIVTTVKKLKITKEFNDMLRTLGADSDLLVA